MEIMNETPRNLLHVPHFSGSIKLDGGCTLQDLLGRPLGFLILIFLETRLSGLSSYPKVGFHSVVIRGDCRQKIDFPLAGESSM